jgi:hypothetical protein
MAAEETIVSIQEHLYMPQLGGFIGRGVGVGEEGISDGVWMKFMVMGDGIQAGFWTSSLFGGEGSGLRLGIWDTQQGNT